MMTAPHLSAQSVVMHQRKPAATARDAQDPPAA